MNVADLFIKLGIKGGDESARQVRTASSAIDKMRQMSIETKVAITGAFYALQRMMSGSMSAGMEIDKFSRLTGMSTKSIQQLTYAGDQFGVTASEMQGHLVSLQKAGSELDIGGVGMQGLNQMSYDLAKINKEIVDINKMKKDPEYALGVQGRFARLPLGDAYKNNILGKTGASDNLIQALKGDAFNKKNLDKAPILSGGEIKKLANAQKQWKDMMANLDKMIQQFVAEIAPEIIKLIKEFMPLVKTLAGAVTKLVKWLNDQGYFKNVAKAMKGEDSGNYDSTLTSLVTSLNSMVGAMLGVGSIFGTKTLPQLLDPNYKAPISYKIDAPSLEDVKTKKRLERDRVKYDDNYNRMQRTIENNINNTFNIKSTEPKEAAKEVGKQVTSAIKQLNGQLVGG